MPRSLIAAICLFAATNQLPAADWPAFLGPEGAARSSDVVPTTWSNSENLAWKVDLPGTGSSSPIIIGDHLYVVTRRSGTIIFKPGDSFGPLARNVIEDDETVSQTIHEPDHRM
ncbi:hypothetical protein Mal15_23710 [Stieleria maiorica]|uniref:Pyrrolo-quinoline quinone n=1 Tax=Stieleria maiorica TaxID=2795974 RepID=A0A5B9MCS4_9BACT|nr:PQQ-binding-like beta-propeller repeat protein [Stieleria maiorica]QEF98319.1 hypothetical protein Mal15_23710 [Stieleria maiorica]